MTSAAAKLLTLEPWDCLSPEEYLAIEDEQEIRHELVGGRLFAMAGESRRHNEIAGFFYSRLLHHLHGSTCRVYIENVKARVHYASWDLFYYPDIMVACDPRDTDPLFIRYPKLLIEVISESTRGTDTREKLISYLETQTVEEYAMVEQEKPHVTVLRRQESWVPDIVKGLEGTVKLKSVGLEIAMRDIYGGLPKE